MNKLPEGFNRAGSKLSDYDDGSVDLMEIKMSPNGQIVVGIQVWFGNMCLEGNERALALLSSLPKLVQDAVDQHLKVQ